MGDTALREIHMPSPDCILSEEKPGLEGEREGVKHGDTPFGSVTWLTIQCLRLRSLLNFPH